jgi:hypothetical protein
VARLRADGKNVTLTLAATARSWLISKLRLRG